MPPKKRLQENRALPKRWKFNHGAYYYLVPASEKHRFDNKAWFRLGKTLAEAHQTYSERIYETGAKVITMQDLLDRFEFEYLPKKKYATQKYYIYALPMVRKVFTTNPVPVALVEPCHAYQMVDYLQRTESTKKAKQAAECLSSALSFAVRLGVIKVNPLIGQFTKPATKGRKHAVSDAELIAFAETLPRKWQLYIMLKLHCKGRRKGELLRLKHSDLVENGIRFTNNKRDDDVFDVPWTKELRAIVKEIISLHPQRIGDSPLFFGRGFKPYIDERGQTSGFDSMWQRHMTKAVSEGICNHFREHDLRGKAVENDSLLEAARKLRHTNPQTTKTHYRPRAEEI